MSELLKISILIGKYAIFLLLILMAGYIITTILWLTAIEATKENTDKENQFIQFQIEKIPKNKIKSMSKARKKALACNVITEKRKVG
jgi:hypothetical protein